MWREKISNEDKIHNKIDFSSNINTNKEEIAKFKKSYTDLFFNSEKKEHLSEKEKNIIEFKKSIDKDAVPEINKRLDEYLKEKNIPEKVKEDSFNKIAEYIIVDVLKKYGKSFEDCKKVSPYEDVVQGIDLFVKHDGKWVAVDVTMGKNKKMDSFQVVPVNFSPNKKDFPMCLSKVYLELNEDVWLRFIPEYLEEIGKLGMSNVSFASVLERVEEKLKAEQISGMELYDKYGEDKAKVFLIKNIISFFGETQEEKNFVNKKDKEIKFISRKESNEKKHKYSKASIGNLNKKIKN